MKLGMAYYGSHLPDHLLADMTEIRRMGCDELLITLSENDFNIFKGKVAFAPAIAHDLGMRILANFWGFACAFGGGRLSLLLTTDSDVWVQLRDGSRLGQGCMNHPALLALARRQVDRCTAAGYDGFFWDEPTVQDCFCPHCRAAYERAFGGDLLSAGAEQIAAFRQASIAGYVQTMSDYVKSQSAGLETATCVMPVDQAAWADTAAIASLDTFGTDPYWFCWNQPVSWVSGSTRDALALCRQEGKRSLMWLQGWALPAGRETEIEEAARLIAAEGPDALYTWGYRAGQGTNETCADPARAWESIKRAYNALKGL
jgi:hypothetical protein